MKKYLHTYNNNNKTRLSKYRFHINKLKIQCRIIFHFTHDCVDNHIQHIFR